MSQANHYDVLGIGNAAVDEIITLERFPTPDSKIPVRSVQRQGGGLIATALVAAARQGARAAFCSRIGADELSAFALDGLAKEGVDCAPCFFAPDGVPYHAYILVDQAGGTRTILYEAGRVEPPLEHITPELVESARVLLIDHHAPLAGLRAAQLARARGIPVVADLESRDIPGLDELLASIDHLLLGRRMAEALTGLSEVPAMVAALYRPGQACCAVTDGERGCWFAAAGGTVAHVPAYRVPVVDTTGCGDVFHGVYAAALARGAAIRAALEAATAAAALKAGRPGAQAGIPARAAVERFMAEQRRD